MSVGILGIQGCIAPHEHLLRKLGVEPVRVRSREDLGNVDRIILPGGESTTMLAFLQRHDLFAPLREFGLTRPVWGICAGAILAAKEVVHPDQPSLDLIDIRAHRNFYGSQLDSFTTALEIPFLPNPLATHFIRAPHLEALPASRKRDALVAVTAVDEKVVFFSQGRVWATAFHAELGEDASLHEAFLRL